MQLYQGGQYWLYKYSRYADIRLVFAPEQAIAAFGGDPDNFQFPRWCLDMSLLRAYENGKPAETPLPRVQLGRRRRRRSRSLSRAIPGTTTALLTVAQLKTERDLDLPFWLLRFSEMRGRIIQYREVARRKRLARPRPLDTIENTIKVRRQSCSPLLDDRLMERKAADEETARVRAKADADLKASRRQRLG